MDALAYAANLLTDEGIDIPGSSTNIHDFAQTLLKINHESFAMLEALDTEYQKYLRNMRILFQEAERKLHALSNPRTRLREIMEAVEPDIREGFYNLRDLVGEREPVEHDAEDVAYLPQIFRFWRRFGGRLEASPYEELWQWVAGRPLTWEM